MLNMFFPRISPPLPIVLPVLLTPGWNLVHTLSPFSNAFFSSKLICSSTNVMSLTLNIGVMIGSGLGLGFGTLCPRLDL